MLSSSSSHNSDMTNEKLKIGIVCFPFLGGSGVMAAELGKLLAEKGHQVHFVGHGPPFRLDKFSSNIFFHEVEVVDYPVLEYPPYDLALANKIAQVAKSEHLNLIHVHYAMPHAICAFLAKQIVGDHLKVVTTLHGTDITILGEEDTLKDLLHLAINRSDAITAVSKDLIRETRTLFDRIRDIDLTYNFVDERLYYPRNSDQLRTELAIGNDQILLHVSNFRPVKRVMDVADIFFLVNQRIPSTRLMLVGEGPDMCKLQTRLHELKLDTRVHYLWKQPDIPHLMSLADVLLLPSEKESFGLVALEAMACGVPTVGSTAGGIPELIIHGENGFLAPIGDTKAMAEYTIQLLTDESLMQQIKRQCLIRFKTEFNSEKFVTQYEQIYYRSLNLQIDSVVIPMAVNHIDFHHTGTLSKLILDYLEEKETTQSFYKYPMNMSSFPTIIDDKSKETIHRKLLVEILEQQHHQLPHNERVMHNIQLLTNPDTYTVTTGHQLNIFTGPVYYIYKIISTINLAKKISAENPRIKVVPVFWMASEDHDFAEINHINLFKKKIIWNVETDIKGAVGRISISSNIEKTIEEVKLILGNFENGSQLASIIEEAYLKNGTLADATRYFLHQLFHNQGLIILNADNHHFKKIFIEIVEHDILTKQSFNLVNETIEQLKNNYKIQANPREINFFYLVENYRALIVTDGDQYKTNDNKYLFTKEELQQEIKSFPERFSPNVLMRTLYQERLLPNLAYIGGPNELAYWFELRTTFDSYHVNFPMLVLRNCVLIIDEKTVDLMKKFHLSIPNLFLPIDQLIKSFVMKNSTDQINLEEETALIDQSFAQILGKAEGFDPALKGRIRVERLKMLKTLNTLEKKFFKAKKKKFESEIEQLKKMKENLFPNGNLQERHENFIKFYLRKGNQYLPDLINMLEPLGKKHTIISENIEK